MSAHRIGRTKYQRGFWKLSNNMEYLSRFSTLLLKRSCHFFSECLLSNYFWNCWVSKQEALHVLWIKTWCCRFQSSLKVRSEQYMKRSKSDLSKIESPHLPQGLSSEWDVHPTVSRSLPINYRYTSNRNSQVTRRSAVPGPSASNNGSCGLPEI